MKEQQSYDLTQLLERRNEELRIFLEIGTAITSSLDLQEILRVIMEKVSILLKPSTWSLLLADKETGDLIFEIAVSPAAEKLKGMRLKSGEGIAGWVVEHAVPLLIPDVTKDPRFAGQIDKAVAFITRSIVCVPIKSRNRCLGVIELVNSFEEQDFSEADLRLISAIADYAAIAIENARHVEQIRELVITDDLTGLHNSRHMHELLDHEFERAKRYTTPLSLVFIDLDHFKEVNDTHGHLVGSRLLTEIGRLIKENLRTVDYAARYGGDEFVLILPNTAKKGAVVVAAKLRNALRQRQFHADDGTPFKITASFGIASYPEDATTKRDLVSLADQAMYAVKESSRDGIRSY
jgi:diguanylate cyclase (GGDEF)-like protein